MTKIFTQNDVLRYLYKETSVEENIEIEKTLLFDNQLRDFYTDMQDVIDELSKLEIKAPDRIVENILEYSRSKHIHFI